MHLAGLLSKILHKNKKVSRDIGRLTLPGG
jgi:hypothetical protein